MSILIDDINKNRFEINQNKNSKKKKKKAKHRGLQYHLIFVTL
jgi:hypothetical protein